MCARYITLELVEALLAEDVPEENLAAALAAHAPLAGLYDSDLPFAVAE